MTPVLDLPTEIILEVVHFLELPDPISLVQFDQTCSYLYALSDQHSFWISVLETTRMKSLIACPPYTDLSRFPLETLKSLVFSWKKLQYNWNQDFPQIVGSVTSTCFVCKEPVSWSWLWRTAYYAGIKSLRSNLVRIEPSIHGGYLLLVEVDGNIITVKGNSGFEIRKEFPTPSAGPSPPLRAAAWDTTGGRA
ncbi:hypothetical protein DFH08DRAFT_806723 [Mycena albidolilacea]|uniref:F-box domain-containing protein n=1 Tax=Mycena albidolilacea TaxID=1033008 RepID=A0AAD7EVL7_9AGAR|nr:hypothetical protein DFH08DRAFT_806723 [Mycena albidolilacea]